MTTNDEEKPTVYLFMPANIKRSKEEDRRAFDIARCIRDLTIGTKPHEREKLAEQFLNEALLSKSQLGFLIGAGAAYNLIRDNSSQGDAGLSARDRVAHILYGLTLHNHICTPEQAKNLATIDMLRGELATSQQRQRESERRAGEADAKIARATTARDAAYQERDAAKTRAAAAEAALRGATARADGLAQRVEALERQLAATQRALHRDEPPKTKAETTPPPPPPSPAATAATPPAFNQLALPTAPAIIIPGKWSGFEEAFDGQAQLADRLWLGPAARREIRLLNGNNSAAIEPCMHALNALAKYYQPWCQTRDQRLMESYLAQLADLRLTDESCQRSASKFRQSYSVDVDGKPLVATRHIISPGIWDPQRSFRIYYVPKQMTPDGKVIVQRLPQHGKTVLVNG